MPPKSTAVGAISCIKCKNVLNRADPKIKCGFCRKSLHLDCAIEMTPGLTRPVAEAMLECAELIFKCESCKAGNSPSLGDIVGKLNDMENRMEQLPIQVSTEISVHLEDISNKINNCVTKVEQLEEKTSEKFRQLEIENNSLRKQLNRADIIINGLPSKLTTEELLKLVMNICKHYKVELAMSEINTCCWIHKKKDVLVKFNNVAKRDLIMKKYHEKYDLKFNQIYNTGRGVEASDETNVAEAVAGVGIAEGDDIEARIYLNDNLTAAAAKIKYLGRKLVRDKKVKKFKLMNLDIPKAKLTFANGSEKVFSVEELYTL